MEGHGEVVSEGFTGGGGGGEEGDEGSATNRYLVQTTYQVRRMRNLQTEETEFPRSYGGLLACSHKALRGGGDLAGVEIRDSMPPLPAYGPTQQEGLTQDSVCFFSPAFGNT